MFGDTPGNSWPHELVGPRRMGCVCVCGGGLMGGGGEGRLLLNTAPSPRQNEHDSDRFFF